MPCLQHGIEFTSINLNVDFRFFFCYTIVMENEKPKSVQDSHPELSDEEIRKNLNIPPRDEVSYPMPAKEDTERAGAFLWKMNLLASSHDLNLRALIWEMYVKMDDYLHLGIDGSSVELAKTLVALRDYIVQSKNPLFKEEKKK